MNNKALSWLDLGELEQAERCWEQALRADPRHPDATYNVGLLRWRAARITDQELVDQLEAVRAAHAAAAGIADGCTEYLLGSVHLERGDITAAEAVLREAIRLAPTDPRSPPPSRPPPRFNRPGPTSLWLSPATPAMCTRWR